MENNQSLCELKSLRDSLKADCLILQEKALKLLESKKKVLSKKEYSAIKGEISQIQREHDYQTRED